ncbi:MAG: H-NS histone family protein, partial [Henriciella sp.]|uniref:H-NS histone family protein n=1 Tax=Henriciella sp. TaxID=1968823 RepID=UPI003C76CE83
FIAMNKAKLQIEGLSMDELISLRDEIQSRIQAAAEKEMKELEARLEELRPLAESKGNASSSTKERRTKVKPKFKDPKTGNTWSGRGLTPVWLREYEARGQSREEFAIR